MPALADLQSRYPDSSSAHRFPKVEAEVGETLVADARGGLSPAQVVELKLRAVHSATLAQAGMVTPQGKRRSAK